MSKFKVIGVNFKKGAEDIAVFNTEELARQHMKTTFKALNYDKLLLAEVANSVKEPILIPDDVAENNEQFVETKVIMEMTDWNHLLTQSRFGTLTEFLLPRNQVISAKSNVSKLLDTQIEQSDDNGTVQSVSLRYVHPSSEPLPYTRITRALQKELETALIGANAILDDEPTTEGDSHVQEIKQTRKEVKETIERTEKTKETSQKEGKKTGEVDTVATNKAEELAEKEAKELAEKEAKELAEKEAKELAEKEAKELAEKEAKELAEKEAKELAEKEAKELSEKEAKELAEKEAKELAEKEAKELAEKEAKELADKEAKELAEKEVIEKDTETLLDLDISGLDSPKVSTDPEPVQKQTVFDKSKFNAIDL